MIYHIIRFVYFAKTLAYAFRTSMVKVGVRVRVREIGLGEVRLRQNVVST